MNGRFLIFGVIVSVLAHAAFLFVLSFSSKGAEPTAGAASAAASETPPAVQSETPPAVQSEPTPVRPVSLPDARATPVHEPAPTPEAEWETYTVKRGDMLERLCKKAGCSVSEAARYNKTTYKKLSNLKVGQKIKLPKFLEN